MGAYHGRWGFEAMSHRRAVLAKRARPDLRAGVPAVHRPGDQDHAEAVLMHRLSALDAQFLAAESGNSGSQYCSVAIYQTGERRPITAATMRERLAERIGQCAPLRWKLVTVPFGLDRPVFVDTEVDLSDHVCETTLAAPADERTLGAEVADILSMRLDRDKPLWKLQVIHGLPGRTAVVMTLHHAAVDGIAASEIFATILDGPADTPTAPSDDDGDAGSSQIALAARGLASIPARRVRALRSAPGALAHLDQVPVLRSLPGVNTLSQLVRGDLSAKRLDAPRTRFNAKLSPARSVAFGTVSLSDVKAIKNAAGHHRQRRRDRALRRRIAPPVGFEPTVCPPTPLVAYIPVSTRLPDAEDRYGNAITSIIAPIPTHLASDRERLEFAHDTFKRAKQRSREAPPTLLSDVNEPIPLPIFGIAARGLMELVSSRFVRPPVNLIISNVPGSPIKLTMPRRTAGGQLPDEPGVLTVSHSTSRSSATSKDSTSESSGTLETLPDAMGFDGRFSTRAGRPGHARHHRRELLSNDFRPRGTCRGIRRKGARVHDRPRRAPTACSCGWRRGAGPGGPQGDDLPAWEPGAHVDLLLDEGLVRQYSLCGDPRDAKTWRVGVLLDPASRGGSRHVHERLVEGGSVRVRGPRNHFALVDSPRYLFIAGGIGITPIIAMIDSAQQAGSDWTLIYLGRSRTTMAFADVLADSYGDRVTLWPNDQKGQFDLESALNEPADQTLVYCCGPEPLLAAVEQHCAHWPEGSLHIERFRGQGALRRTDRRRVGQLPSGVSALRCDRRSVRGCAHPRRVGGRRHTDHVVVSGRNLRHLHGNRLGGHTGSPRFDADRSRTCLRQQDPHMCIPFPQREVGVGPMTANYPDQMLVCGCNERRAGRRSARPPVARP